MIRRVLFVDDESNILDGLRRMLRPYRSEWDMRFANSGSDALKAMAQEPVDVLVTDMRMPGMDGDELLAVVRERYPLMVRMVLTGQCNRGAMLRLARLAHRVFTKPCDPDALKVAVRRACSLQDLLHSSSLAGLVGRLGSLPTPPALYTEILAELEREDGSIIEVGNLIARDVGTAAKLMQMANSSLLGLRQPTTSPVQAVQVLGAETTKSLILVSEVLTRYNPAALHPFSIDDLWSHSQQAAGLAAAIAAAEAGKAQAGDARLAGLLHDVGRLTLATQQPAEYREVLRLTRDEQLTVVEAERSVFGASHPEVGAYLLGLWGLPNVLVEAVAWHHNPSGCPVEGFSPLTAVHAAEAILAPVEGGPEDMVHLDRLQIRDRFLHWMELQEQIGVPK